MAIKKPTTVKDLTKEAAPDEAVSSGVVSLTAPTGTRVKVPEGDLAARLRAQGYK